VFVRSAAGAWAQKARLAAADGLANDNFGDAVAISGPTAVVGAPSRDAGTGAGYVFARSATGAWSPQAELTAADAATGAGFGWSVAVSGSTAVLGAIFGNSHAGAGYVFVRSAAGTWSPQAELTAADSNVSDELGFSVVISGSTVVAGAPGRRSNRGAAYVFTRSGTAWSQQAELTAGSAAAGDDFGAATAISGSTAVFGAPGKSASTGTAFIFASV
jgi:hypothetical protein